MLFSFLLPFTVVTVLGVPAEQVRVDLCLVEQLSEKGGQCRLFYDGRPERAVHFALERSIDPDTCRRQVRAQRVARKRKIDLRICAKGRRCRAHPNSTGCRNVYVASLSAPDALLARDRILWEVVGDIVGATLRATEIEDLDRWFWRLYDPRGNAYSEPLYAACLRYLAAEIVGSTLYRPLEAPDQPLTAIDRLRVYEVSFYSWLANPDDPLARKLYALALVAVGGDEEVAKLVEELNLFPADEAELLTSLLLDRVGTLEMIRDGRRSGALTCISCFRLDALNGFWEALEHERSQWFASRPRNPSTLEGLQRSDAKVLLLLN